DTRLAALQHFNIQWAQAATDVNDPWPPYVQAANDQFIAARNETLPDGLWESVPSKELASWPGLPYALLYLRWEALYPDEWTAHVGGWGTKTGMLQCLAEDAAHLPADVIDDLIELIVSAVLREHRRGDDGYARLVQALRSPQLHDRLQPLTQHAHSGYRLRAGYLLWLLRHPEAAHAKPFQWKTWLATHG
ncbi:MAG: hypothetical protein HOY71_14390, partial [Nonomuraea sp.]|nr:hypothetical protein [Nonomuraea sp.]